jgi:hypothetical protein
MVCEGSFVRRKQRPAKWRWNPVPGWPEAPPGFLPSTGWSPDPHWPPPPPGWQFVVKNEAYRRRHRVRLAGAGVAAVLAFAALGAATSVLESRGICFDPPPGDQSTLKFTNDTPTAVRIRATGTNGGVRGAAKAGETFADIQDPNDGVRYEFEDRSSGRSLGCIAPPVASCLFRQYSFNISAASPCR